MRKTQLKAYAKLNLSLAVVGVNSDGYHELDTIMQSVDLYDTVTVELNDSGKITVKCSEKNICDNDNIVYYAAKSYLNEINSKQGADVCINKNIPLCAGLGGGSADAAAVLNGLNFLFDNKLSVSKLLELALPLGADVPFCVLGGTKRCKGIGEYICDRLNLDFVHFVLVNCGEKESTAKMYKKIDSTLDLPKPNIGKIALAIKQRDYKAFCENINNAFSVCYNLNKVRKDAARCGADAFCLSGSGSFGFCVLKSKADAQECCRKLKELGYTAYSCSPVNY